MAGKRESIKKALGITEYPWSTDEEDNDLPPQPSTSDGDIGGVPMNMRQPSASSTPNMNMPSSSRESMPGQSSSAAGRKSQPPTRMERNLFWSLLCSPDNVDLVSRSRCPNDSQRQQVIRPSQVSRPPPESFLKSRTSPLREIRGFLAIKKASRYVPHRRPRPNLPSSLTVQRGSGHMLLPSKNPLFTAGHSIDARIKRAQGPGEQASMPSSSAYARAGPSCNHTEEAQPSTSSGAPRRIYNVEGTSRHDTSIEECMVLDQDTDDEMDSPQQCCKDDVDQSADNGTVNLSAQPSVSLEEEVLVVSAAEEAPIDLNTTENNTDPAIEQTNQPATSTPNLPHDEDSQGSKRKRDSTSTAVPEESFKELNTNLLRLLECPVCMEWMEPPMSQCRRGHLVCVKCRARLSSCPVCRTTFSSVRNRAMEGVAEMLRYPCRHGCAREVRLRRRASHEANCAARRYACPVPACAARAPLPKHHLPHHLQTKHLNMLKIGRKQKFTVKLNSEQHDNWIIMTFHEIFHLKIDVDVRTWGLTIYVAYIGPKKASKSFIYEVSIDGKHNSRKLIYSRATHSDLESAPLNVSRHDCFHLSINQALNFLRVKNRHFEADNTLNVCVSISKDETEDQKEDSCDS